jgi:hypothetical protein
MEGKYFSLGNSDTNQFVKVIRIVFGITLWITIVFLLGFGFYQIWSGLGRANRFIEIASENINLRKNPLLPAVRIMAEDINKIELFPFSLVFFLKSKKRILLRLGTTFHETNEIIKDEILTFAERNSIPLEIIEEKI